MESPEVVRAVADLDVAEALLVRDLDSASQCRAMELARRVAHARWVLDGLRNQDFPTSHHVDEDPERSMQEDAVCW